MQRRTRSLTAVAGGLVAIVAIAAAATTGVTTSAADVPDHGGHGSDHGRGALSVTTPRQAGPGAGAQGHGPLPRPRRRESSRLPARMGERRRNQDHRQLRRQRRQSGSGSDGLPLLQRRPDGRRRGQPVGTRGARLRHGDDGDLELVAVEWIARGPNSNPPGPATAPTVLGTPMHILNPAVGFHIMHAWIWKPNPAGMFADFNPDVTCP